MSPLLASLSLGAAPALSTGLSRPRGCFRSRAPAVQQRRGAVLACQAPKHDNPSTSGREPEQQQQQQQQQQQEQRAGGRKQQQVWRPASSLSGWAGSGSLLLGLGAVTGGGLLGSGFDVTGPWSVAQALGVLGATVGFHELGHFLAARGQGVHVTKFAIGFGPTLLKYQGKEVEYSLRALPLGGFVAFPDDDPDSPYPEDDPDLLRNRPVLDRVLVVSAGVVFNMILAYAICVTQASTVGVASTTYQPGVVLGTINPGSVAEKAGLRRGDIVLELGGQRVAPSPSSVSDTVDIISRNPKKVLEVKLEREGQRLSLPLTVAEMPDGSGRIGVALAANATVKREKAGDFGAALALGAKEVSELAGTVLKGLSMFVTNFSATSKQVSGPLAIVAVGAEVARRDSGGLLQFAALININLAIVNALPLPALDGGYLVFLIYEALQGKKVDPDLEKGIMASGLLLLTSMGLFLIVRDTLNLSGLANLLE